MQQVRRTNTARIAELERHVTDLQQQMTTGRQELIQLKLFVEERKVINERLRRQLQVLRLGSGLCPQGALL